jgi:hypothetical protein
MEDFQKRYKKKFDNNFDDKMTPSNYLIQQTVLNNNRQLSLVEKINHKLIVRPQPRPFKDSIIEVIGVMDYSFSDFEDRRKVKKCKMSKSKSSQQLNHPGDNNYEKEVMLPIEPVQTTR